MNIDYLVKDKLLKMLDNPETMDINLFKNFINQHTVICETCRYTYIVKCHSCNKIGCYYCYGNRYVFKCEYCDIYYCENCNQNDKYLVQCIKLCSNRYHCYECNNGLDLCRECSTIKLIEFKNL